MLNDCYIIRDTKHNPSSIVEAVQIDTTPTMRLRLLTGEHFGEVRMKGEYEIYEKVKHEEASEILAAVWDN